MTIGTIETGVLVIMWLTVVTTLVILAVREHRGPRPVPLSDYGRGLSTLARIYEDR